MSGNPLEDRKTTCLLVFEINMTTENIVTNEEFYEVYAECIDSELPIISNIVNRDLAFIDDKDKAKKVLNLFRKCVNCNCCIRHQVNKPREWQLMLPFSPSYNSNELYCFCACRHIARFICYLHPSKND